MKRSTYPLTVYGSSQSEQHFKHGSLRTETVIISLSLSLLAVGRSIYIIIRISIIHLHLLCQELRLLTPGLSLPPVTVTAAPLACSLEAPNFESPITCSQRSADWVRAIFPVLIRVLVHHSSLNQLITRWGMLCIPVLIDRSRAHLADHYCRESICSKGLSFVCGPADSLKCRILDTCAYPSLRALNDISNVHPPEAACGGLPHLLRERRFLSRTGRRLGRPATPRNDYLIRELTTCLN